MTLGDLQLLMLQEGAHAKSNVPQYALNTTNEVLILAWKIPVGRVMENAYHRWK